MGKQPRMVGLVADDSRVGAVSPETNRFRRRPALVLDVAVKERHVGSPIMAVGWIIKPAYPPNHKDAVINRTLIVVNEHEDLRRARICNQSSLGFEGVTQWHFSRVWFK